MTTNFLERNKKKGLLEDPILFARQNKVVAALFGLVVAASVLVMTPGSRFARWGAGDGEKRSFGELLTALRAARTGGGGWGAFFRAGRGAAAAPGAGSLDYVKGSRADLDGGGSSAIAGFYDPADAKKLDKGVELTEIDLGGQRESLLKNAVASGLVAGLLGNAGVMGLSGLTYAGRGFFSRGEAVATALPSAAAARNGFLGVAPSKGPPTPQFLRGVGGSARLTSDLNSRSKAGMAAAASLAPGRALTQLAQGGSVASVKCGAGCPGERAANNTAAIYDGNPIRDLVAEAQSAPPVTSLGSPDLSGTSLGQNYVDDANRMASDAQQCQQADSQYKPREAAMNQEMQRVSQKISDAGCGSGGGWTSAETARCEELQVQLSGVCSQYQEMVCAHAKACPLTAAKAATSCAGGCPQAGVSGLAQQGLANLDDGAFRTVQQ